MIEFLNKTNSNIEVEIELMCEFYLKEIDCNTNHTIKVYWEKLHPKNYAKVGTKNSDFYIGINHLYLIDSLDLLESEDLRPAKELGLVLAHEFIHIKQKISGMLAYHEHDDDIVIWNKSENFVVKTHDDFESDDDWSEYYHSLPWEQEAFENQDVFYEEFKKHKEFLLNKSPILRLLLAA